MNKLLTIVFSIIFLLSFNISQVEAAGTTNETMRENKVTILLNTKQLYQNGNVFLSTSPHIVQKGVTFISFRALADRLGYKIAYNSTTKQYMFSNGSNSLQLAIKQKQYTYNGQSFDFTTISQPFIAKNGTLMIPLRDVTKQLGMTIVPKLGTNKIELIWYTPIVVQEVKLEAMFATNKEQYKIGEPIEYVDQSVNVGSPIKSRTWTNNEMAFFTSGPQTITLQVENELGQQSTVSKTIYITEEVMYTKLQFDALVTNPGQKIPIARSEILKYTVAPFQLEHQPFTLVRSNSPESIVEEGIYYQDDLSGKIRFFLHHKNTRPNSVKIYLLAKNNGTTPASVTVTNAGLFGPSSFVSATGKNSAANYLKSLQQNLSFDTIKIEPDRAELIMTELSDKLIPTNNVITMNADIYADQQLTFQIIVLDENNDILRTYPFLHGVKASRDGKHIRGTFENGNRQLVVSERIGTDFSRIIIADGKTDPFVTGVDKLSSFDETNAGNYGVVYTLVLEKLAANTALVLNPRGGHYAGAFLVNDQLVMAPEVGILQDPNEAAVLYRTGMFDEKVTIQFFPAAGSNLPINFLTIPLATAE